jgi:hypothetical protein
MDGTSKDVALNMAGFLLAGAFASSGIWEYRKLRDQRRLEP